MYAHVLTTDALLAEDLVYQAVPVNEVLSNVIFILLLCLPLCVYTITAMGAEIRTCFIPLSIISYTG